MRIVYIGAFRMPNRDAAAARVLNMARALRLAGHEVSFISWGGEQRDCDLCDDGRYRVDGFEYVVTDELDPKGNLMHKVHSKLTRGQKTKQLLRQRTENIDVIITYNGSLTRWLIGYTSKHGIKLVNDITEWYDYSELKITDRLPYAIDMYCIQKRVKNKIVISSYLNAFYEKTHNIVVPATCDAKEAKWQKSSNTVLEHVGTYDGVTLIYAGTPARKDAVHHVINAVQRLINEGVKIRFLIVGAERDSYLKSYGDLLSDKNLSKKIIFIGRVSQDDVPSFYALADFMVLLRESNRKNNAGFPTKFSESFTSGTPIIANLTSDLGKYLIDGKTGFVVREPNSEAIYETLKKRVSRLSPQEIEKMKGHVKEMSVQVDYHSYVLPLRTFMKQLE